MPGATAAGSTKKITNSAQKPIFCALFYSQGPPISSTDAEFYSRRSTFHFKSPAPLASEHKNGDFVFEMPKNGGFRPQKRTKTSILCSKTLKTGVPKAKKAQKPRFCARNARKRGFQTQKAHKNPDFVLETPENEGYECKKRTKMGLLCAFLFRKAAHCGPRCLRLDLGTAQLWSNHLRPALRLASGLVACGANRLQSQPSAEPTACGADRLQSRLPVGLNACGASRLRG